MTIAPSIEERAKKAKTSRRAQGASGRLHRTEAGDWVWSSSDEEDDEPQKSSSSNNGHDGKLADNSPAQATLPVTNAHHTLTNDSTLVKSPTGKLRIFYPILLIYNFRNVSLEADLQRTEWGTFKAMSKHTEFQLEQRSSATSAIDRSQLRDDLFGANSHDISFYKRSCNGTGNFDCCQ